VDSNGAKELEWGPDTHKINGNFEGEKGPARTCSDMSGGRYTQSNSAQDRTSTMLMQIEVY